MASEKSVDQLLSDLLKPTYVYRMARAKVPHGSKPEHDGRLTKGARKTMAKAEAEIRAIVEEWARG